MSLMRGTALATGVLAGLIWGADPVRAANECGPAPAGGGTVVCTPGGNPYPNGISYTPSADLTLVTQSGVTINSGHNIGIAVAATGTQRLAITAQAGTTITVGNNSAIAASQLAGSITINTGAILTTQSNTVDVVNDTGSISVVNSGQITSTGSVLNAGILVLTGSGSTSIQNSGTIKSSGAGITASSSTVGAISIINSGQITGAIGVNMVLAPGATLTNTGTIIGTTGIAIDNLNSSAGSTINLNAGAVVGALALSSAADVVNIRGGTLAGNINGASASDIINFALGSNTFVYGAAFGFNNISQVNVSSGTVVLDGANSAINISVLGGTLQVGDAASPGAALTGAVGVSDGTLSGFGTVIGNVGIGNGGTLAPGGVGSPGTLTVQGNLAFATAASYMISISANLAGNTAVTGTATLAGTVLAAAPSGSYRFNTSYTILTSGGGRGGTEFNALVTAPGIAGALIYPNADDVQLVLTSNLGGLAGLNGNQRAVANALDAGFNATGNTGGLGSIFNGNIPSNLTQASGETAVGVQQTTFDAMTQFMSLLTDPFIGGRGGGAGAGAGATPFAEASSSYAASKHDGSGRDAYAMFTKAPLSPFVPSWSVWASGFGGSQTTDGNAAAGSNTTTSRLGAVAVGADYRFSPYTLAGFALAGGGTSFGVANGGSGQSDLFQAGAFIRHTVGAAYLAGTLAYGWQDITTDRTVGGIDRLHAAFDANAFSGRAEAGYRFVTPWMNGIGLTPYAAAQFITIDLPAYAEQDLSGLNAFALNYAAKSVTDPRGELGWRSDKSFAVGDAILTLRGRAAWAYDFNTDRSIAATFQSLPVASFTVNGAAPTHNSALTTASAEMKFSSGLSLAATFEGEFSDVTTSYAGKGVLRYQW